MHIQTADSLDKLDPFDAAFVDAVLHLRDIDAEPTAEEFRDALTTLSHYYAALVAAPVAGDPAEEGWLDGHTIDSVASQLAFLFTRFGVLYVSQATGAQLAAFDRWWASGAIPEDFVN